MAPALMLLLTIFFWGTAFRASAVAAEDAEPITITALRAGLAAIALVAAVALLRARLPSRPLWGWTAITGLLMVTLTLEGIAEGTARAGAGNAAILLNASPFFVLVLGRAFLRERATPLAILGLGVGFAGIVVMVSTQLGGATDTFDFVLGMLLALLGALGWAVGVMLTKVMFTRHADIDMLGLTAAQYVIGGAAAIVLALALGGARSTVWGSGDLWAAIAWIAIGGSAIATLTFFGALKRMSATTVTAWQFLAPVVAILTEMVYGNMPDGIVLAGMSLAIVGVALVNGAPALSRSVAGEEEDLATSGSLR